MLPGMDGLTVWACDGVSSAPICILMVLCPGARSTRPMLAPTTTLLKPLNFDEPLARIRAQLRRRGPEPMQETLRFADLTLNPRHA